MSHRMNPHQPKHLNSHHLDTVIKIFAHPTSHNIRWQEVLHRPRHKDIDTKFIVDLRHMLREAGYGPTD